MISITRVVANTTLRTVHCLLNIDAGERVDEPDDFACHAHILHIAAGGHAGDAHTMRRTLLQVQQAGTAAGAHPSYPDRENFGRVSIKIPISDLAESLHAQMCGLAQIASSVGVPLVSLKPHGALYHDANQSPHLAQLLATIAAEAEPHALRLVGPPNGFLQAAAHQCGVVFYREAFADRVYETDGTLRDRTKSGAMISDPVIALAQAKALCGGGDFETLCVHGDNPQASEILRLLWEWLS